MKRTTVSLWWSCQAVDGERKLGQNAGPAVETVGGVCVGVTGVAGGFAVAFNRLKLKGCKFANVIKCAQRAKRAHVNPPSRFRFHSLWQNSPAFPLLTLWKTFSVPSEHQRF